MAREVLLYTNPALRKESEEVPTQDGTFHYLKPLIDEMVETMYEAKGYGLAANQIGENLRLFVMDANWDPDDTASRSHTVILNPKVVATGNLVNIEEGCLSIPGAFVRNERYNNLKLTYTNMDGERVTEELEGLPAHVVQHEMEHLDGKLFIDSFKPLRKQMALKKHKKYMQLLKKLGR